MDQQTPLHPMAATTPLVATLTAEEWNLVQHALQALMQPVRSVSEKLQRQLFAQARERNIEEQQP